MSTWQKSEKQWSDAAGKGKRQPGSGNKSGAPGDIRFLERTTLTVSGKFLLEAKFTEAESISVKKSWLKKIRKEALLLGRIPLLGIDLNGERWLAIPEAFLQQEDA